MDDFKLHSTLERNDVRVEEKLLLVKDNPAVVFTLPKMTFGEGRQSRVSALEIRKLDGTIRKVIWKRCGVSKSLTHDEATELCSRVSPYREVLKSYGWEVPQVYHSEPVVLDGESLIFSYEQLISVYDAERMFKDSNTMHFERFAVIKKVLQVLLNDKHQKLERKSLMGTELSVLPYGIDLKLGNCILDGAGVLYFIDFFGPKELTDSLEWKSYSTKLDSLSSESLKVICATREGCILRMLRLSLSYLPDHSQSDFYRKSFVEMIFTCDLPQIEKDFILNQIAADFPLLDIIYEEKKV